MKIKLTIALALGIVISSPVSAWHYDYYYHYHQHKPFGGNAKICDGDETDIKKGDLQKLRWIKYKKRLSECEQFYTYAFSGADAPHFMLPTNDFINGIPNMCQKIWADFRRDCK